MGSDGSQVAFHWELRLVASKPLLVNVQIENTNDLEFSEL